MYENILLYNINKWILWNINNFQEFYTMCSDCILPASPNSFQTHALSYSPSLHPSLHQGQLVPSRYSWMCGLPPERGTYQGYTLRENWSFLSRQLTLANSSSARGRPLCQLPTPCWGLVCHGLTRVLCVLWQVLWVHMCGCPAVSGRHCFLEAMPRFWSVNSLRSLFCYYREASEDGVQRRLHEGLDIPQSPFPGAGAGRGSLLVIICYKLERLHWR